MYSSQKNSFIVYMNNPACGELNDARLGRLFMAIIAYTYDDSEKIGAV